MMAYLISFPQLCCIMLRCCNTGLRSRQGSYTSAATMPVRRITDIKEDDDEFEIIDASSSWVKKHFGEISKASVGKQVAIGGTTGWASGYLFGKVGKAAAGALGGSLLLITIANHQGLITIHWGKVEKNMKKARRKLEKDADRVVPMIFQEIKEFVTEHAFLAGAFAGGFLLGLAT